MPIRTASIEDNKKSRLMNKMPISPSLPMTSPEGNNNKAPILLPKTPSQEGSTTMKKGVSPLLNNATARLNLNHNSSPSMTNGGSVDHTMDRKAVHLASEKKRRQNISNAFSDLRVAISNASLSSSLSCIAMPNDSKAAILKKAAISINEQADEIRKMRTRLYGEQAPSPPQRMVTLVSSGRGRGGRRASVAIAPNDEKDVMESAATLTSLKHLGNNDHQQGQ